MQRRAGGCFVEPTLERPPIFVLRCKIDIGCFTVDALDAKKRLSGAVDDKNRQCKHQRA